MYFRRKTSAGRAYLQIVESHRDGEVFKMEMRRAWKGALVCWPLSGQIEIRLRLAGHCLNLC